MIDELGVENGGRFVRVDQGSAKRRPWNPDFERLGSEKHAGGGGRSRNGRHGTAEQATTTSADAGRGDDPNADALARRRRRRIYDPESGRRPKVKRPSPRFTIVDGESPAEVASERHMIGAGEAGTIHHGKPELESRAAVPHQGERALGFLERIVEEILFGRSGRRTGIERHNKNKGPGGPVRDRWVSLRGTGPGPCPRAAAKWLLHADLGSDLVRG